MFLRKPQALTEAACRTKILDSSRRCKIQYIVCITVCLHIFCMLRRLSFYELFSGKAGTELSETGGIALKHDKAD